MTDMEAHHAAEEIAKRVRLQRSLGRPSVYNIAREVLMETFAEEP